MHEIILSIVYPANIHDKPARVSWLSRTPCARGEVLSLANYNGPDAIVASLYDISTGHRYRGHLPGGLA